MAFLGNLMNVPSILRSALTILVLKFLLRTRGYGWTLQWIRRGIDSRKESTSVQPGDIGAAERAVAMAGALYPGRALCLEQSLTLYLLLRRQGVPVKYRQGVQAYPFQAHAWVEFQGEPVNDVPEHVRHFVPLSSQLP